ncbi:MAG: sensor histidine kinase, partial [Planctomycetota bacterium]
MTGARRRILVTAIIGVVLLGPALALSLWSLRSISVEQERLLESDREQRRGRLRRAGERTHHRVQQLAGELRAAASGTDVRGRARALRALLDREKALLEGIIQFGPQGEVVATGDSGLVLPRADAPSADRVAAALAPGERLEGEVLSRPADAAAAYAEAARRHVAEPAIAARCLAAASRTALAAGQHDRSLQFADAALDGPLRADAGWYAFTDARGSPLAWTLLLQKVRALTALLDGGASAMRRPVFKAERDAALQQLSELIARNELALGADALQVFISAVEQAGGPAAVKALRARQATVQGLAETRTAIAAALAARPGQAGILVVSEQPLRLMLAAPVNGASGGGVATSIRLAGLAATFTDEVELTRSAPEESFRLLAPDGAPLPGQGGALGDPATIELALPGELKVTRAAVWAPLGGGSIGAVGDLAKTAYIALGIATLVAFVGGLVLFTRVLTRELRLARMRSDFISSVTHELRTPLTSIQMFVETLLLGRVSGEQEQRECLEVIGYEAGRLRRMIDRVLNFDRTERGARDYQLRSERLEEMVAGALRLFGAAEEGVRRGVEVRIDPELPPVRADRDAIEEVLVNLLSNAAKYSPAHSSITLSASATNGRVRIRVADQGMGIQSDERERIFQGFYRSERARERGVPGSGIGLALARQIARAHGGDLTVQSEPESGSTFML